MNGACPSVLHVPNEPPGFDQAGLRSAMRELSDEGTIKLSAEYSLLRQVHQRGRDAALKQLMALAVDLRPDIILFHHVDGIGFTGGWLQALRERLPQASIVYDEGDAYGSGKPIPKDCVRLAKHADAVIVPGAGNFLAQMQEFCAQVIYVPHAYDHVRFQRASSHQDTRGVVMIANNVRRRRPRTSMPGSRDRNHLVKLLHSEIGSSFHLFGRGWKVHAARGYMDYDEQVHRIGSYTTSVNWDFFPTEPGYYSDRLPISMISARPHVTTRHPGLEWLPDRGLFLADSPREAVDMVKELVEADQDLLTRQARIGSEFAEKYLNQTNVLRYMFNNLGIASSKTGPGYPWA